MGSEDYRGHCTAHQILKLLTNTCLGSISNQRRAKWQATLLSKNVEESWEEFETASGDIVMGIVKCVLYAFGACLGVFVLCLCVRFCFSYICRSSSRGGKETKKADEPPEGQTEER